MEQLQAENKNFEVIYSAKVTNVQILKAAV